MKSTWQSGGEREFKILGRGRRILFRLKSRHNAVGGVGFVHFSILPVSLAWAPFSVKSGAESEGAMRDRVERYQRRFGKDTGRGEGYRVAGVLLVEPTFLPMGSWVREPSDWSPNIVQGRNLDLSRFGF